MWYGPVGFGKLTIGNAQPGSKPAERNASAVKQLAKTPGRCGVVRLPLQTAQQKNPNSERVQGDHLRAPAFSDEVQHAK